MRKECGCLLVKRVELPNNRFIHCPFLTYWYMSLKESIQTLFNALVLLHPVNNGVKDSQLMVH